MAHDLASSDAPAILIIDADEEFATATAELLQSRGFRCSLAHTLALARPLVAAQRSDLLLIDPALPDGCGLDLLADIEPHRHVRIALLSASPSIETAMRAVSLPVADFLRKPLSGTCLDALLVDARSRAKARTLRDDTEALIGDCDAIRSVLVDLRRIATTSASVLIAGESGTGKELAARALHRHGERAGPFVAVNCGAIAPELLASHLFGHERGSFTGAAARHIGFFEQANRGTLLLDEITEMPAALQVYLLRALETGLITRVGGVEPIAFDVRIVAATNRDPMAAIDEGLLREDLFYRLADFVVELPPLRARGNDPVLLAHCFVDRLNLEHGGHKRLASDAERVLLQYSWPGNVRELRSVIQRAYILGSDDVIRVQTPNRRAAPLYQDADTITFSVGMSYAEVEQEMLMKTLARFDNDKTRAARALGVSVRTIHNHLSRRSARDAEHDPGWDSTDFARAMRRRGDHERARATSAV